MKYKNGDYYHGEWSNNLVHGQGKLLTSGKDVFEGQFESGKITGLGKKSYQDGSYYEG